MPGISTTEETWRSFVKPAVRQRPSTCASRTGGCSSSMDGSRSLLMYSTAPFRREASCSTSSARLRTPNGNDRAHAGCLNTNTTDFSAEERRKNKLEVNETPREATVTQLREPHSQATPGSDPFLPREAADLKVGFETSIRVDVVQDGTTSHSPALPVRVGMILPRS